MYKMRVRLLDCRLHVHILTRKAHIVVLAQAILCDSRAALVTVPHVAR